MSGHKRRHPKQSGQLCLLTECYLQSGLLHVLLLNNLGMPGGTLTEQAGVNIAGGMRDLWAPWLQTAGAWCQRSAA